MIVSTNITVNLDKIPQSEKEHLRADYIELLCLVDPDRQISVGGAADHFRGEKDLNIDLEDFDPSLSSAQASDIWVKKSRDYFQHIGYRIAAFREFYPFYFSENKRILHRHETITDKQKLYIFMLVCSCLRHFDKTKWPLLTGSFEYLSYAAIKAYLPIQAEVHVFGKNSLKIDSRYSTPNKAERIKQFAQDIFEKHKLDDSDVAERLESVTGDGGADIVAWIPFGTNDFADNQRGTLIILGQSTCKEDWGDKQFEVHNDKWRNYIDFKVSPLNAIFIPVCYRNTHNRWYDVTEIGNIIVIDRLRFVHLLQNNPLPLDNIPYDFVDEIVNYKQSLV